MLVYWSPSYVLSELTIIDSVKWYIVPDMPQTMLGSLSHALPFTRGNREPLNRSLGSNPLIDPSQISNRKSLGWTNKCSSNCLVFLLSYRDYLTAKANCDCSRKCSELARSCHCAKCSAWSDFRRVDTMLGWEDPHVDWPTCRRVQNLSQVN